MTIKCDHCYGKGYIKCKTCHGAGKISENKRLLRSFIRYPKTLVVILIIILLLIIKYLSKRP